MIKSVHESPAKDQIVRTAFYAKLLYAKCAYAI